MKPDERAGLVKQLQEAEWDILETKAREYASDTDTLANFKIIADILNVAMPMPDGYSWTPQMICAVYWLKHVLAILDNSARGEALSESEFSRTLDARVYTGIMYFLNKESYGCEEG